ncbi:MAG: LysM peptidoglycan-binding domain-containing protein, partial [Bacteroidales bacterium]|nr:LysM peptidoglycan-binding domain-containing protein [Bacteroidales bacterium]
FWDIYNYLPRETRGYVPAFVGALYTLYYYKEYGLIPDPISIPGPVDTLQITKKLHFGQVNELVGVSLDELRNLNPQYIHDIVPGTEDKPYLLKLPYSYINSFVDAEDSLYTYKDSLYFGLGKSDGKALAKDPNAKSSYTPASSTFTYTVKSGDTLGAIASRNHVTINQIKSWNNLKSNTIRVGQKLKIQGKGSSVSTSSGSSSSSSSGGYSTYTVKAGDSLYLIARKYKGMTASRIQSYNGLKSTSLKPGQVLKIPTR